MSKPRLGSVALEVTSRCELDCRYCYNIWKRPGAAPPTESSYRRARRVLKRLFSTYDVDHVTMTGGEPLLAERFLELVLWTRMKGKTVTVITSGSAGSTRDYQTLVELGVGLFELPVHAHTCEPHDWMTNKAGSWQLSLDSIRTLRDAGGDLVCVIVLAKKNAHLVGDTLAFINNELGVRRVMLNRFNIGGRGISERHNLELSAAELRDTYHRAAAAAAKLELDVTSNVCTPVCLLNPSDFRPIRFSNCSNDPERLPTTLDLDGNLRLCNHSPTVAANIFDDAADSIYTSPHAIAWRQSQPQECGDCRLLPSCRGGCRAAAEQVGLTIADADPILSLPSCA